MIRYRKIIDHIAFNQLYNRIAIPDRHLMIGQVEQLHPIHTDIYSKFNSGRNKPTVLPLSQTSREKIDPNFENITYSLQDFNQGEFYLGEALGGWD